MTLFGVTLGLEFGPIMLFGVTLGLEYGPMTLFGGQIEALARGWAFFLVGRSKHFRCLQLVKAPPVKLNNFYDNFHFQF
jgi:hypothetical protein